MPFFGWTSVKYAGGVVPSGDSRWGDSPTSVSHCMTLVQRNGMEIGLHQSIFLMRRSPCSPWKVWLPTTTACLRPKEGGGRQDTGSTSDRELTLKLADGSASGHCLPPTITEPGHGGEREKEKMRAQEKEREKERQRERHRELQRSWPGNCSSMMPLLAFFIYPEIPVFGHFLSVSDAFTTTPGVILDESNFPLGFIQRDGILRILPVKTLPMFGQVGLPREECC